MYEYRETWYKVSDDGTEHEKSWRFTTGSLMLAMKNFETATHDFCHEGCCKSWDLLTLEICRMSNNDREALASAKLYADAIQA